LRGRWKAATLGLLGALAFASPSAAETTIKFMGWIALFDFQKAGWNRIVEDFQKANPDIKIDYIGTPFEETLNQAMVAILGRNAPDIFQVSSGWIPQLQGIGGLEPLNGLFSADELAQFPERMIESTSITGKVYSLPWLPGPIVLTYNRTLMKEAGLDPDKPPKTWLELTEAAKKICALGDRNGGKVYGIALRSARHSNSAHWAIPVIWGFGGHVVDADGKFDIDNPGAVAAFEWYRDMNGSGCSPDGFNIQESRNIFSQGRAGFVFEGPWVRGLISNLSGGKLKVAPDGDIWIAPMPAGPDGKVRSIANSNELSISAQSQRKEAAAKFVRFILGDRAAVEYFYETSQQLTTGRLDILRSGKMGQDPYVQAFVAVLPESEGVPIKNPKWISALDILAPALQSVIKGADARSELKEANSEILRMLSR
jgi:multiple sugar transport system substrate-binding protein